MSEITFDDLPDAGRGTFLAEYGKTLARLAAEIRKLTEQADDKDEPPLVEQIFGIPFKASGITDEGMKIMTLQDITKATGLSLEDVSRKIAEAECDRGQRLLIPYDNLNQVH